MRGTIIKRYKNSWNIIIDSYIVDPETGNKKRKRNWYTVKGTKREAEAKLAELLNDANKGQLIEPSKITFGEWLDEWVETAIKPPKKRQRTYETYKSVIENHLKPKLGGIRLQQLKQTDIKRYYNRSTLSESTLEQHHTIIHSALKAAQTSGLVQKNVASLVIGKPHAEESNEDVIANCWDEDEARKFLAAAKNFGPQAVAFYTLALDTGARKAELCGLKWENVDLKTYKVSIIQQITKLGNEPKFGPVKNGVSRVVDIAPETVSLLLEHKAHQEEIKKANSNFYHDHGLVFAKEWEQVTHHGDTLGNPLQMNNIGQREFAKIIRAAGVKPIKFHGLRHTCATLLLKAGVPIKVVQERLGHKKIETTLNVYAHALPSMQRDAAIKLDLILHKNTE